MIRACSAAPLAAPPLVRGGTAQWINQGPAHDVLGTSLNTGDHACSSSHVSGRATPHDCPPVPTGAHVSCDHTATTNGDGLVLPAAPDDSRRHRQHRLSPLGCLDSSGATGEARSDEADGMTPLPPWHAARLPVLLDALGGVPISEAERRSLVWLAGFEAHTVENIAEVIIRARQTGR